MGGIFETPLFHPGGKGCSSLFRAGEGKGSEKEEWHPISITPLRVKLTLNSHFSTQPLARG